MAARRGIGNHRPPFHMKTMLKAKEVNGSVPWALARPNKQSAHGRLCAQLGCKTKLSIYNETEFCWKHRKVTFPKAA